MSPDLCRNLLLRSVGGADLAIVVGRFESLQAEVAGGRLDTLCDWLNLPRLAVVDVSLIEQHGLPERPDVDAVMLDAVCGCRSLNGMITDIETLWRLPVVGALGSAERSRRRLARLSPGVDVPRDLLESLNSEFRDHWQPERFAQLVDAAPPLDFLSPQGIYDLSHRRPTVAVAYDEAFFGYFPSTLDQLELLGAQVVDFSPLRDESLPPQTEIVYLGCGRPEAFGRALSENHCMKSALHRHVACGGRIYGEVGGAAYLCQMLETPSGDRQRMCGILPAIARLGSTDVLPQPAELTVTQENWLVPQGMRIRGYRSGRWCFEPLGCRLDASQKACCQPDLLGCNCVVGSRFHFHFAAFPEILQRFFQPTLRSSVLDPWQVAS